MARRLGSCRLISEQPMIRSTIRPFFVCTALLVFTQFLSNGSTRDMIKLINQQEGILAYKIINGTYLLNHFLNHGDVRHQIQLRNIGDLRIPFYTATQSELFVRYRAINT